MRIIPGISIDNQRIYLPSDRMDFTIKKDITEEELSFGKKSIIDISKIIF